MCHKVILLTLLLTVGFTTQDCGLHCRCPEIEFPFFDINDIQVYHSYAGYDVLDSVSFSDYRGLQLEYLYDVIAQQQQQSFPWHFSLMSQAYGCSCAGDGWNGSKEEQLSKVTIITLNDFDDNHMANDTITDLFAVKHYNDVGVEYIPIDEHLTNIKDDLIVSPADEFFLEHAPTSNQPFKVKMIIELSTNEVYEAETEEIVITL